MACFLAVQESFLVPIQFGQQKVEQILNAFWIHRILIRQDSPKIGFQWEQTHAGCSLCLNRLSTPQNCRAGGKVSDRSPLRLPSPRRVSVYSWTPQETRGGGWETAGLQSCPVQHCFRYCAAWKFIQLTLISCLLGPFAWDPPTICICMHGTLNPMEGWLTSWVYMNIAADQVHNHPVLNVYPFKMIRQFVNRAGIVWDLHQETDFRHFPWLAHNAQTSSIYGMNQGPRSSAYPGVGAILLEEWATILRDTISLVESLPHWLQNSIAAKRPNNLARDNLLSSGTVQNDLKPVVSIST